MPPAAAAGVEGEAVAAAAVGAGAAAGAAAVGDALEASGATALPARELGEGAQCDRRGSRRVEAEDAATDGGQRERADAVRVGRLEDGGVGLRQQRVGLAGWARLLQVHTPGRRVAAVCVAAAAPRLLPPPLLEADGVLAVGGHCVNDHAGVQVEGRRDDGLPDSTARTRRVRCECTACPQQCRPGRTVQRTVCILAAGKTPEVRVRVAGKTGVGRRCERVGAVQRNVCAWQEPEHCGVRSINRVKNLGEVF